jgi:hypothetical protein
MRSTAWKDRVILLTFWTSDLMLSEMGEFHHYQRDHQIPSLDQR